jgi:TolA-binding protein
VSKFVSENFIPVKIHVKEQPDAFKRFGSPWTPTQILMDPDGVERHRIEGFSPVDDLLAQLQVGLAKSAFQKGRYEEAEKRFAAAYESYPKSGVAPEAAYWKGVAAYKATNKPEHLAETGRVLAEKYPNTDWARKASVWLH